MSTLNHDHGSNSPDVYSDRTAFCTQSHLFTVEATALTSHCEEHIKRIAGST